MKFDDIVAVAGGLLTGWLLLWPHYGHGAVLNPVPQLPPPVELEWRADVTAPRLKLRDINATGFNRQPELMFTSMRACREHVRAAHEPTRLFLVDYFHGAQVVLRGVCRELKP